MPGFSSPTSADGDANGNMNGTVNGNIKGDANGNVKLNANTKGTTTLPPFSAALTAAEVKASTKSYPADYLISTLLTLSAHLIDLTTKSNLFGKPTEPNAFIPSLDTLFTRLSVGQYGPSYLPPSLLQVSHIKARIASRYHGDTASRPLADYEDLYYAVLSCLKEVSGYLCDHVRSGFHAPSAHISEGGDTILGLHQGLADYWGLLNSAACGKALDEAVRLARYDALRTEVMQRLQSGDLSQDEAADQLLALRQLRAEHAIDGIVFIAGWSPGMISVVLQQRYKQVFALEKAMHDDEQLAKQRKEQLAHAVLPVPRKVHVHQRTLSRLEGVPRPTSALARRALARREKREREQRERLPAVDRHVRAASEEIRREASGEVLRPVAYRTVIDGPIPMDDSPETVRFHQDLDRKLREAIPPQEDRTAAARRQMELEWDMKRLRVDEYQNHLRERYERRSGGEDEW